MDMSDGHLRLFLYILLYLTTLISFEQGHTDETGTITSDTKSILPSGPLDPISLQAR